MTTTPPRRPRRGPGCGSVASSSAEESSTPTPVDHAFHNPPANRVTILANRHRLFFLRVVEMCFAFASRSFVIFQ